jgi:hypothetical protein
MHACLPGIKTPTRACNDVAEIQGAIKMAQFLGAIAGVFLISRLFWAMTKAWPDSAGKAFLLNVVCAAIVIPTDYLLRGDVWFLPVLVSCQSFVLIFDVFRLAKKPPANTFAKSSDSFRREQQKFDDLHQRELTDDLVEPVPTHNVVDSAQRTGVELHRIQTTTRLRETRAVATVDNELEAQPKSGNGWNLIVILAGSIAILALAVGAAIFFAKLVADTTHLSTLGMLNSAGTGSFIPGIRDRDDFRQNIFPSLIAKNRWSNRSLAD